MRRIVLSMLISTLLLGCSGGGLGVPRGAATSLFVIGNSITLTGPNPSLGWSGDWGLAASSASADFSHLTAAGLNLPLSFYNVASLEQSPSTSAATIQLMGSMVQPGTAVVIELGEDADPSNIPAFQTAYDQLAQTVSTGRSLTCVSTFWVNTAIDQMMANVCAAHGGTYVYIGDIFPNPNNPDYQGAPVYADPAVNRHPHDWSMQQIATRILATQPSTRQ